MPQHDSAAERAQGLSDRDLAAEVAYGILPDGNAGYVYEATSWGLHAILAGGEIVQRPAQPADPTVVAEFVRRASVAWTSSLERQ